MNQLWDESDNLLDYIVTIGENEKARQLALAQISAESSSSPSFLEQLLMMEQGSYVNTNMDGRF